MMKSIGSLLLPLYLSGSGVSAFAFVLPTTTCPGSAVPTGSYQSSSSTSRLSLSSSSSALPSSPFSSTSIKRRIVPSTIEVYILEPMGNGTFGQVCFAKDEATGKSLVAKSARAATSDERAKQNANSYLDIEAYVNSKLCPNMKDDTYNTQHVAPYLGEYTINSATYLIWEASGEYTLEDYIEMEDGLVQLAIDLGIDTDPLDNGGVYDGDDIDAARNRIDLHTNLAAEVMRQILEGLAYCHSCGIVHRDVKPANILVDPKTQTLRLIDFGSACCMSSWGPDKLGYKGDNKGPRSILYCAPEEFVDEEHPYAFDMYGAATAWLRTVLSEDGHEEDDSRGLGDEDDLFKWRLAVRDYGHNLVSWEEYATLHSELPIGWDSLFGSSRSGIQALRLLSNMMSYYPEQRQSAAEALVGPYLNGGCDAEPPPELPPAAPFSIMSHIQRWKKDKEVHDGECRLEDLFTKVVAVELDNTDGLVFGPKPSGGVEVTGERSDAPKLDLHSGDSLLAIGSIDVESASIEHIKELLNQWPEGKPIPLLLVRDAV